MNSDNLSKINAVIPLGGKGSRLKDILGNTPKPIFPILGKSTLFRICETLKKEGISKIFFTIGYESSKCIEHIKFINKHLNLNVSIYQENEPLGESGALWHIKENLSENFFFINGDLIFSIDLLRVFDFHSRLNSDLTLVTHTSNHPFDSDLVSAPNGTYIEKIFLKNQRKDEEFAYLGFSAIALIQRKLLFEIPAPKDINYSSLFHHLVNKALDKKFKLYSYNTSEYIRDMGTPSRLEEVKLAIQNNHLDIHNYQQKQKALFIDRDNTIVECKKGEYILANSAISFLNENIKKISIIAKDYQLVILVTNQPQIAMGNLSLQELEIINSKIVDFCLKNNLKIDVISFCPHHPHKGFNYEVPILKLDCFCRKPNPGMFLEQAFLRNIDLSKSLMIGDSLTDQMAAKNAGCNFYFVDDL